MLRDLAALTPPAVVCIAFLAGVVAFLRWAMAPKRNAREDREGTGGERDISGQ